MEITLVKYTLPTLFLGQEVTVAPIKLQLAGNISYANDRLGTFGFGFAKIQQYDSPSVTTLSANYNKRIGKSSSLILNASEARTSDVTSRLGSRPYVEGPKRDSGMRSVN